MVATQRPKSGPPGSARSSANSDYRRSGAVSARGHSLRFRQSLVTPSVSSHCSPLGIAPPVPVSSDASSRRTSTPISLMSFVDRSSLRSSCDRSLISDPADLLELELRRSKEGVTRSSDAASSRAESSYGAGILADYRPRHELVPPPWGPQRANIDKPPPQTKVERQQQYQQVLDEQLKTIQAKRCSMKGARKEHAATSLEMTEALAGYEENVRQLRGVNVKELVEAARVTELRKRTARHEEREDYHLWAKSAEEQQAALYHAQQSRRKEEWTNLADHWKSAAAEKHEKREAERSAALQAEREMNYHLSMGMVPQRRMKRGQPSGWPRQPLVLQQEIPIFGNIA